MGYSLAPGYPLRMHLSNRRQFMTAGWGERRFGYESETAGLVNLASLARGLMHLFSTVTERVSHLSKLVHIYFVCCVTQASA